MRQVEIRVSALTFCNPHYAGIDNDSFDRKVPLMLQSENQSFAPPTSQ